jgi:hypothetical protein
VDRPYFSAAEITFAIYQKSDTCTLAILRFQLEVPGIQHLNGINFITLVAEPFVRSKPKPRESSLHWRIRLLQEAVSASLKA